MSATVTAHRLAVSQPSCHVNQSHCIQAGVIAKLSCQPQPRHSQAVVSNPSLYTGWCHSQAVMSTPATSQPSCRVQPVIVHRLVSQSSCHVNPSHCTQASSHSRVVQIAEHICVGVREVLNLILKCSFFTSFSKVTGFIYNLILRLVVSNVITQWCCLHGLAAPFYMFPYSLLPLCCHQAATVSRGNNAFYWVQHGKGGGGGGSLLPVFVSLTCWIVNVC